MCRHATRLFLHPAVPLWPSRGEDHHVPMIAAQCRSQMHQKVKLLRRTPLVALGVKCIFLRLIGRYVWLASRRHPHLSLQQRPHAYHSAAAVVSRLLTGRRQISEHAEGCAGSSLAVSSMRTTRPASFSPILSSSRFAGSAIQSLSSQTFSSTVRVWSGWRSFSARPK